jgi:beta-alanine degradation protein BauB
MPSVRTVVVAALIFATGVTVGWAAQQQSATRREPQFENEHVRVWKSIIMPRQPLSQHRHDHGRALIALTDGQLKVVNAAGRVIDTYNWERGKAYWLGVDPEGETHADVNDTDRPIEVIVVELKRDR